MERKNLSSGTSVEEEVASSKETETTKARNVEILNI
jgi:hypothetical protein